MRRTMNVGLCAKLLIKEKKKRSLARVFWFRHRDRHQYCSKRKGLPLMEFEMIIKKKKKWKKEKEKKWPQRWSIVQLFDNFSLIHFNESDGERFPLERVLAHFAANVEYGWPWRSKHKTTVILSQPRPPIWQFGAKQRVISSSQI